MRIDCPAYFWVGSVGSQIHLEMHGIDCSVPQTLADISHMTYTYMAIEKFPSSPSCLRQAIVKNPLSVAFPTLPLRTT